MNHYPHHIGDFNAATRHTSRLERSIYRDLIEYYYDTESPVPVADLEKVARKIMVRTEEERQAMELVLSEFFTLEGDIYRHNRCDEELEKYREKMDSAVKAGKASASARFNRKSTGVERPLNARWDSVQPTNNHKPETIIPLTPNGGGDGVGDGIGQDRPAEKTKGATIAEEFEAWFAEYPLQVSKLEASRQWVAYSIQRPPLSEMLKALRDHKHSDQWMKDDGKFIPRPDNYLAGMKWLDRLPKAKKMTAAPIQRPALVAPDGWREYVLTEYPHKAAECQKFSDLPENVQREVIQELSGIANAKNEEVAA